VWELAQGMTAAAREEPNFDTRMELERAAGVPRPNRMASASTKGQTMDFCLFFIATFIAYRMGARGVWLFAIFMFSWLAFVIWLIMRDDKRQAREREQKREDAEFERTLMLVRAMNPALADEIAEKKAYERLSPLMTARPAIHPAWPHSKPEPRSTKSTLAVVGVLILIAGALVPLLRLDDNGRAAPAAPQAAKAGAIADAKAISGARGNAARAAVRMLKNNLRDPSSFELVEIFTDDAIDNVCVVYRARNGFGGLNLSRTVVSTDDGILTDEHQWVSRCSGGTFYPVDAWVATMFN
jgi:hypothetical protein